VNPDFIAQKINKLDFFPVPNSVIIALLKTIVEKKCTYEDIGSIVELDASLSFQILKIANSAYFGFKNEIRTIERAIMLIGTEEVRNLTLALSLVNQFKKIKLAKNFDFKRFWFHSLLCASCAKMIASQNPIFENDTLYVMGLLHDLGRLIMAQVMPDQLNIILLKAQNNKVHPWKIEKESGLLHTEIGKAIAKRWSLTKETAEVLVYHHNPTQSPRFCRECAVVKVASSICKQLEIDIYGEVEIEPLSSKVLALAGITYNDFDELIEQAKQLKDEVSILTEILVN